MRLRNFLYLSQVDIFGPNSSARVVLGHETCMIQTDAVNHQVQVDYNRCSNGNYDFWWRPVSILNLWELTRNCSIHLRHFLLQTCSEYVSISWFSLNIVYVLSTGFFQYQKHLVFQTLLKRLSFAVLNLLTKVLKILGSIFCWFSPKKCHWKI